MPKARVRDTTSSVVSAVRVAPTSSWPHAFFSLCFGCHAGAEVERRLQSLQKIIEEAAARDGRFSLEVPLDRDLGTPAWCVDALAVPARCSAHVVLDRWWNADNQDLVGDFLTHLGLACKFRNPLASAKSQYPVLWVSWFQGASQWLAVPTLPSCLFVCALGVNSSCSLANFERRK